MKRLLIIIFFLFFFFADSFSQTVTITAQWKLKQEDKPAFKEPAFIDTDWQPVTVPAGWAVQGLNKEKTTGWYRVHFSVPDKLLNQELVFFAGVIDDADETYFNGELIGATGKFPPGDQSAWDVQRKYTIPKKLVQKENVIAIRVYNGIGDGGIHSGTVLLMTRKAHDEQVARQLRSKKSYYQLTTSNGLIAAVYNEQTGIVENIYPHIFSYYDSGMAVKAVIQNLQPATKLKPVRARYVANTHVIEVKYDRFSIFYYASFTKGNKIFYALIRGKEKDIRDVDFNWKVQAGSVKTANTTVKNGGFTNRYFLFAFSDSLNALPGLDIAIQQPVTPEEEVQYMQRKIASCKIPAGISTAARNVTEQGISILKMSQVPTNEVFPLAKGQVLASLRPGVWAICWVRDAAFAIEAMSKLGMYTEAKDALEFMLKAKPSDQYIQYIHTDRKDYGMGVPYIISLARYFGNGREESDYNENGPNIEIDDLGLFLTALYHYVNESSDTAFFKKWDKAIRIIGNAISHNTNEKNIIRRDSGPWEHHLPGKEFMWASGTCARGLQLAAVLQQRLGMEYQTMEQAAQRLYNGIMQNCLINGRYIKGNATERDTADHHYYDAATFELFANGLITDKKLFGTHMQEYNKHNRALLDPARGYIRFNSSDSYENQEWPFAGLRVAVAQKNLGSVAEANKLLNRITSFASRNNNQVPEILSNDLGLYKGAIPMVGYGSGAYILAILELNKK